MAALAAGQQGKFWEFHDLLFKNYKQLSDAKIEEIAKDLVLDLEMFEKDRKAPKITEMIRKDIIDGSNAGIRGTPTVFVNGRALRKRTLEEFRSVIEGELGKLGKGSEKSAS